MVHLFPLIDLVDIISRKSRRSIAPLHTWSVHHFPVTCLALLDGGRIASAAQDGHVAILELFSKVTLAKIKLPHPIESLAHHDSRLYAGSDHGTIYSIDLNAYAMHQTEKQGATLSKRMRKEKQAFLVAEEKVFGKEYADENESLNTFQTEWIGHEHAVSSLAVAVEDMKQRLISGDRLGEVRIWDIESRTCLNTIRPWSNTAMNAASQEKASSDSVRHPIASIVVFRQPSETDKGMFSAPTSGSTKSQSNIANLLPPLQKYTHDAPTGDDDDAAALTPVPFLRPNQTEDNLKYWEARPLSRKRKQRHIESSPNGKSATNGSTDELRDSKEQIAGLQKELEQKRIEIMRWEKVNNTLMTKMKSKS
jgi:WD40 repeat protein